MCIGDWRLGRLIRSNTVRYTTNPALNLTIRPNRSRVGLTICFLQTAEPDLILNQTGGPLPAAVAGIGSIAFANTLLIQVDGVNSMRLSDFQSMVHFTLETHGDLPTRGFVLSGPDADMSGVWIEYLLPEDYLSAGLHEFQSQYKVKM